RYNKHSYEIRGRSIRAVNRRKQDEEKSIACRGGTRAGPDIVRLRGRPRDGEKCRDGSQLDGGESAPAVFLRRKRAGTADRGTGERKRPGRDARASGILFSPGG